jgi:spermidine/putrescine transport system ATP-binding protein
LVNRPTVLLLDEPLGALDLKLRKEMQVELSNLHQDLGLTFVMVTHDQEEALSLSDRIAVMHEGKIEQIGTPSEIYERPRTAFVADFIGDTNLFPGRAIDGDASTLAVVTDSKLKITVQRSEASASFRPQDPVVISVRPEKIKLSAEPPNIAGNYFEGELKHVMYMGTHVHCVVQLVSGDRIIVSQPNNASLFNEIHAPVYVWWKPKDCLALAQD